MSLRNRVFLPVILLTAGVLAGCGGNGASITHPTPPPSGGFSPSNLNGTYVFSVSGTDLNGLAYAIVGTFTANGSQGITSGVLDMNDSGFPSSSISPIANAAIASGSYSLGVDGRGQIKLNTGNNTPFTSPIVLDFVLQDSTHGLVTEFDTNGSGSGSLDLQSSGVTPTGSYAFIFSGAYGSSGGGLATVGNFTLNASAMTGLEDFNSSGIPSADALSGTFALGPSSTPATQISATGSSTYAITYDVFAVDATHLKFIEMDPNGTLSGDAFAQTSTTMPTGTLAFTLIGAIGTSTSFTATSAGGFLVTDGNGNITSASTEDFINSSGTASTSPITFNGLYSAEGTGRYTLNSLAGFQGASEFAAYPSSGGVLLLELDNAGMMAGAAYPQTSTATPDPSQGYGLNLSGTNLGASTGQLAEVDDIVEFATAASGLTFTGIVDENFAPSSAPNYALALSGSYASPSGGRGTLTASAGSGSNTTLNTGFNVDYYTVDGTTFPFIENDGGQIAAGVFVKQNSSASSSAATRAHMYVLPSVVRPRTARKQK